MRTIRCLQATCIEVRADGYRCFRYGTGKLDFCWLLPGPAHHAKVGDTGTILTRDGHHWEFQHKVHPVI